MNEILIYDLFTALRKEKRLIAGGTGEYLMLQEFLQQQFNFTSLDEFEFALETLMVKNKAEQQIFRTIFQQWKVKVEAYANAQVNSLKTLRDQSPVKATEAAPEMKIPEVAKPDTSPAAPTPAPEAPRNKPAEVQRPAAVEAYDDGREVNQATITFTKSSGSAGDSTTKALRSDDVTVELDKSKTYFFGKEYFPVPSRYLQQNWRSLKNKQETGLKNDIDLDKTISNIAKTGLFFKFQYQRREQNLLSLFIFSDHGDSMSAYTAFGEELAASARESLVHRETRNYYFYNLPELQITDAGKEYILFNEDATQSYSIDSLFAKHNKNNIVVLIYSDAGAIKGHEEEWDERVVETKAFLHYLLKRTACVAWLNPVPRNRWKGTPAQKIANLEYEMQMFEANQTGIVQAINALKGKLLFN